MPTGTVRVAGENEKSCTDNAAVPLAPAAVAPAYDTAPIATADTNSNLIQVRPMFTDYGRGPDAVQPTGAQSEPPPGAGRCRTARAGVMVTTDPSTAACPSTMSE